MEIDKQPESYQAGDIVYVFYRNPHTQNVTNIQEAAVVNNPDSPGELAIFLYETFYPMSGDMAVYQSETDATDAYQYYFGDSDNFTESYE